jgi:hypothetical protein
VEAVMHLMRIAMKIKKERLMLEKLQTQLSESKCQLVKIFRLKHEESLNSGMRMVAGI